MANEKKPMTVTMVITWTGVALLTVISATVLGQFLGNPSDTGMTWFAKGIVAMLIAGFSVSRIAKWLREAFFPTKG